MTNVEKLSYLKLSLNGDAAQIVSSLLVTDANYDIAKRKLEERYNNKLNSIAGNLPSQPNNLKQLKSMKNVALADENFHQPGLV